MTLTVCGRLTRTRNRTAGRQGARPQIARLSAMSGMGGGGLAREVVDMELQNAIQLNDLLVIQDMVQVW